ncbi:polyisoprenoid-binding protein [Proteus sp. G2669]|uniref:YceI family protein n=1 Tax=unclassified Proteus (in: enterobacteria) TaxID=257482 RepID=UPI0014131547|nr:MULTISPECIES: YceI family protein [unclassified Proteus (in: enterobacteria)]NBM54485.1 polyisoprenoid-binding protein [Proteus sp. G2669]UDN35336.1 YceI family protein [Proteus sp. NMG38-2]
MKFILSTVLSSLLLVPAVQANEYKLEPTHTKAMFYIDHFGTSTNSGGFYEIEGDLTYSPEKNIGKINVSIPVKTLNTGLTAFDNHVKSADILDADKYPTIQFSSTKWYFSDNKPTSIEGLLTMKGKTLPVKLTTTKFNCYESPVFNAPVCGGDFKTTIKRSDWGVDFLVKEGMADNMTLKIQVEAIKQ